VCTTKTLHVLGLFSSVRCIETGERLLSNGVNTLRTYTHLQTVRIMTITGTAMWLITSTKEKNIENYQYSHRSAERRWIDQKCSYLRDLKTRHHNNCVQGWTKVKRRTSSYWAITLTSVIFKIYETVLLNRCNNEVLEGLNVQQGGFQDTRGCNMTSFVVRECIFYAKENNSAVYVCFFHGKQLFDRVWHFGHSYKLCDLR